MRPSCISVCLGIEHLFERPDTDAFIGIEEALALLSNSQVEIDHIFNAVDEFLLREAWACDFTDGGIFGGIAAEFHLVEFDAGFLKPENRIGFASASPEITSHVDLDRGRHEIPLYDRSTHETIYGLAALTFILGSRWTWLKPVFKSLVFYWIFHPLYEIITYNRRVIAGCKHCCGFDCAPDLNRFYRSVYLGLAGTFVFFIFGLLLANWNVFSMVGLGLISGLAAFGILYGGMTRRIGSVEAWNFAGNFFTTMVMVSAALIPGLLMNPLPEILVWANLAFAVLLGLIEIKRRDLMTH